MSRRSNRADAAKRVSYPVAIAELMARDPLFTELSGKVCEANTANVKDEVHAGQIATLRRNLSDKYGGAVVPYPPNESNITFGLSDYEKTRAMSYTLSTFSFASGSWGPEKAQRVPNGFFPDPRRDPVPAMYVRVDLSRITLWDLDRLAKGFKEILRNALGLSRDTGAPSDPAELAFLKTVRQDVFYRDLRRYDLHIKHGLSFRLIGILEQTGRTSSAETSFEPRRVGFPVRTESSVADSVPRIYTAIHRTDYKVKRRKLDSPSQGIETYHCPEHGADCKKSCSFLANWWSKVKASLPSDHSGSRSSLPLDVLDWDKPEKHTSSQPHEE